MTKDEAYAEMEAGMAEFKDFMARLSAGEEVDYESGSAAQARVKAASDVAIAHLHAEHGK